MWSWNETVFGITFVTSAPSDRVFRFVPALLSFPGMTSFLTSGSFQQGIRALGAARGVFLQKIRDSLHLGIVRLGLEVLWSPGWNKCLSSSSLWIQDRGVSLSIGSLGKSLPRCKRIYRSNESLNCAEVILRASHSSHCNSWKKKNPLYLPQAGNRYSDGYNWLYFPVRGGAAGQDKILHNETALLRILSFKK